ncbi:MAG: hypothetical protein M3417_12910 [Actinomycetota bacterium]|nr:hypothetical protein [Actinomycetota bacterium]
MSPPPKYPRVPHLAASPAVTADDAVLTPQVRASLLAADVVVEEKLDGMNVVIWIRCAGRPLRRVLGVAGAPSRGRLRPPAGGSGRL